MEDYKNYKIENENGHYKVTAPNGETWTTDTVEEAKKDIDEKEE